ncbi:MAG TPA: hypothetical protein VMU47_11045 [Caldimonas sp.]|nr:hypothetical protein [Caldimonas sp.]
MDVDHIVFSVCCALAGFLLGALFEQSQRPAPTKCAAVLEDGRHLRVKNLTADGSETHCLYEAERKRK